MEKTNKALVKLNRISQFAPAPDVLNFFGTLVEAHKENQNTKKEIVKINAQKEFMIKTIEEKYSFYREVFEKVFNERKETMSS
jgi:hypothetical protein